jgi:hypothetical protein
LSTTSPTRRALLARRASESWRDVAGMTGEATSKAVAGEAAGVSVAGKRDRGSVVRSITAAASICTGEDVASEVRSKTTTAAASICTGEDVASEVRSKTTSGDGDRDGDGGDLDRNRDRDCDRDCRHEAAGAAVPEGGAAGAAVPGEAGEATAAGEAVEVASLEARARWSRIDVGGPCESKLVVLPAVGGVASRDSDRDNVHVRDSEVAVPGKVAVEGDCDCEA